MLVTLCILCTLQITLHTSDTHPHTHANSSITRVLPAHADTAYTHTPTHTIHNIIHTILQRRTVIAWQSADSLLSILVHALAQWQLINMQPHPQNHSSQCSHVHKYNIPFISSNADTCVGVHVFYCCTCVHMYNIH